MQLIGIYPSSRTLAIPTRLTPEEKECLYFLARRLPKSAHVLEIGSYLGAGACLLAEGGRHKGVTVHCVDTWTNLAMGEGLRDTWAEFRANTSHVRDHLCLHRGVSQFIAREFSFVPAMLFIDGDHSVEAVHRDLSSWLPHLTPGGRLLLHDIGWAQGVQDAVSALTLTTPMT